MNLARNIIASWRGALAVVCGLLVLSGCATTGDKQEASSTPLSPDIIRVGEKLEIEFLDVNITPPPKFEQTVQQDGSVSLIYGQKAIVAGKTVIQAQQDIHDLYVPKYFVRLTVNIKREVQFYSVGGEVRSPGKQAYIGQTTVVTAIQSAGDFTVYANKKKVQVIRSNGKKEVVNVPKALENPKLDLPIYPGDRIHVPLSLL
jgi:protein involved in polysaccharide export with SLBB domain